ncbi:MAG: hypothetical protein NTX61_15615 [Bacteroidetes bacterium]|nr:hypothetical protein [Bacteroidota bacterium]
MSNLFSIKRYRDLVFFGSLFFLSLFLSYNIKFPGGKIRMAGEITQDMADYYVYLPATFIYHWDINKFPDSIEQRCYAFTLNHKTGKLIDKTTCGVALLWAPFFLVTHSIAVIWNLEPDGFSRIYQEMTVFPAVFYLVLGLFFLKKFLDRYYKGWIPYISVLLVFAGTNLFYYAMDEGLMSHVNSFFLFSTYLYLLKRFIDSEKRPYGLLVLIAVVFSLSVLIRPTNILLLLWMAFLDVKSLKEVGNRILLFLRPKYIITFLIVGFLVFLPQFFYWKYLTGHFVYYSYPGETFSNWNNPRLFSFWFAPLNGLFLYSPLALFFIAGIIRMIIRKIPNGIFTGMIFLLVSYIFSSWYIWFFGGSCGCRPFVEYFSLMALPFGYFLESMTKWKNIFLRSLVIFIIFFMTYYNLRMVYKYNWNISSTWSWDDYYQHADLAHFSHFEGKSYTYIDDFENARLGEDYYPEFSRVHSPTLANYMDQGIEYSRKFCTVFDCILSKPVESIEASIWVNPGKNTKTGAILMCSVQDWLKTCNYFSSINFDSFTLEPDKWVKCKGTFRIPPWVERKSIITICVWNINRNKFNIDDIRLKFE